MREKDNDKETFISPRSSTLASKEMIRVVDTFKVQSIERKKTKAGKDYLLLKLDDKLVSFFEAEDVAVQLEVGMQITAEVFLSGKYWNGKKLATGIRTAEKTTEKPVVKVHVVKPLLPETDVTGKQSGMATQHGKEHVFSERVPAGPRTYYIEVKLASNGKKYLKINEYGHDGGTDGGPSTSRVMVFEDNVGDFAAALKRAFATFGSAAEESSIDAIKKDYPKAYDKWTAEEDEKLRQRFGESIETLSKEFQRQPGSIRSRLEKLALEKVKGKEEK